jgi:hypothetical protein
MMGYLVRNLRLRGNFPRPGPFQRAPTCGNPQCRDEEQSSKAKETSQRIPIETSFSSYNLSTRGLQDRGVSIA